MKNKPTIKSGFFSVKKIFIVVLIFIFCAAGVYGYKKMHSQKGIQYKTITAGEGDFSMAVSGSGNIIVDQSSAVEPTIDGTVSDLSANVGDKVEKGQFLFNIINDELSVNEFKAYTVYSQSLQAVESAKADKKQARYDLNEGGSKQKAALKQKFESAEALIQSAEENVKSSLKAYQNEKMDAGKRKVTSPISGTVNAVNIKNGDDLSKLSSGSSRVVPIIIGDMNTLKAQVQVNEVDIPNVSIGQKAQMTFSAIDDLVATGKVEKIDSLGTIVSGVVTFNVVINFDDLDPRIKPQMTVMASIVKETKQNVITVPNSAVKSEKGIYYVEILEGKSSEKKRVEVGDSNNTQTEILSGIDEGDEIITQTVDPNRASAPTSQGRGLIPGTGGGRSGVPHFH